MTENLLAIGVSHKTADLALRERMALPEGRATTVLRELVAGDAVHEAVSISTCNRTELYLLAEDPVEAESVVLAALARQAGIRPTELLGHVYSFRGGEAVRHLFEVTGGLDSMIVGEAEVQGQVKRAYELALVEGVSGPITNRLFRDALAAGKRVRTETGIGRSRVSVSSVAVELARSLLGDLEQRRVLVVGAGENGEATAKALADAGVRTIWVANRRYDRAIGLAQRFGGEAVRLDDLPVELGRSDIVLFSTSSPHQIIDREELELVMEGRDRRSLLLIDIAVPRDIDPRVREVPGITLYDMDDLQREVARNMDGRAAEAGRARSIVEEEAERFERWMGELEVVPTVAALRERGEAIVAQVLRENEGRWKALSDEDRDRVDTLAHAIVARLLHEPTMRVKRAEGDEGYQMLQALRELFALEETGPPAPVTSLEERRKRSG
ncbi:MAG: glutamyl-tRNA reductase [Thermoleophilaceae bacterium]|nr:glutamyl-tRNA reductase [Thermoleophilaceae bacterium]